MSISPSPSSEIRRKSRSSCWSGAAPLSPKDIRYNVPSSSRSLERTSTLGIGLPKHQTVHVSQLTLCAISLIAHRIEKRTLRIGDCWLVQGHAIGNGYVQFNLGSRIPGRMFHFSVRAHVFAWELENGRDVPAGLVVMHSCDEGRCCNPAHLSVGKQMSNMHDSVQKGRKNVFGIQKLNGEQVLEIYVRATAGELQKDVARDFGVSRHHVSAIVHGHCWGHVTGARPTVRRRLYPNGARG